MLGGSVVKELLELHGQRRSIREIARTLQVSRNTVRKYLRAPGLPTAKPRPRRPSKFANQGEVAEADAAALA